MEILFLGGIAWKHTFPKKPLNVDFHRRIVPSAGVTAALSLEVSPRVYLGQVRRSGAQGKRNTSLAARPR